MIVYSASELGACTKYLVAKRVGYDQPDRYGEDIPAFRKGHENEAEVLEWLQSSRGYTITATQRELYLSMGASEDGEPIVIQCHPDAIGNDSLGVAKCIEIKRANDDAYKDFMRNGWEHARGLFPRYLYQVSAYHHVTQLPVDFVIRNGEYNMDGEPIARKGGVGKTLMCTDNTCPPLLTMSQLRARVDRIEQLARAYDIPEACDYPNYYCPLSYLHEDTRELAHNPTIDDLAYQYDELRARIKKVKDGEGAKRLNVRNKILKEMGLDPWEMDGKTTSVDTGNVRCTAIWGRTSYPVYDVDRMKQDGVDVEKYKREAKYGWRLNVWVRGQGKAKVGDDE